MNMGGATTVQLVANVVSTVKAARDLAKETGNHDLKERIGDAYDGLNDLRQRVLDLAEENRQLKAELAKRAGIDGPVPPFGYFFDKRHPDQPLCPKCYQSKDGQISFMGPLHSWSYGERRVCRMCSYIVWEREPNNHAVITARKPQTPYH